MPSSSFRVRALIFNKSEPDRILLGFDPEHQNYNLPGGGIHPGELPGNAIYREVFEEAGLKDIHSVRYLFTYDNQIVFEIVLDNPNALPHGFNDPDAEFSRFAWFDLSMLPQNIFAPSEDVIYRHLRKRLREDNPVTAGVVEIYVDGKKVFEQPDDVVWDVFPRLAQEQAKGKKVTYKHIMDDGSVAESMEPFNPVIQKRAVGMVLGFPASILGRDYYKLVLTEAANFDPQLIDHLEAFARPMPEKLEFIPIIEASKPCLKLLNWPKSWSRVVGHGHSIIRVPEDLWEDILHNDLDANDLNLSIGNLTLWGDGQVLWKWPVGPIIRDGVVMANAENKTRNHLRMIAMIIDDLIKDFIPEQKARPNVKIESSDGDWFAKTTCSGKKGKVETTISVCSRILQNPKVLRQALAHEIIHHHLFHEYGPDKDLTLHDDRFLEIAEIINAQEGPRYVAPKVDYTDFSI